MERQEQRASGVGRLPAGAWAPWLDHQSRPRPGPVGWRGSPGREVAASTPPCLRGGLTSVPPLAVLAELSLPRWWLWDWRRAPAARAVGGVGVFSCGSPAQVTGHRWGRHRELVLRAGLWARPGLRENEQIATELFLLPVGRHPVLFKWRIFKVRFGKGNFSKKYSILVNNQGM